jgi:ElaB/YqjD/DUF883 family membrane-anchored ribosome-binding protein
MEKVHKLIDTIENLLDPKTGVYMMIEKNNSLIKEALKDLGRFREELEEDFVEYKKRHDEEHRQLRDYVDKKFFWWGKIGLVILTAIIGALITLLVGS